MKQKKTVCGRELFFMIFLIIYMVWGINPSPSPAGESAKSSQFADLGPKSHIGHWTYQYNLIEPKSNPLVQRVHKVFETVRSVADKRGNRNPRLNVVNSEGDPWALALPDGYIVLSKKAVEICYQGVEYIEGDARIAFIFGHELGHMADDDFWHLETFMALSGDNDPDSVRLKRILEDSSDVPTAEKKTKLAAVLSKEMKADDNGFLYAAIAGYRVDMLLGDNKGKQDFFTHWVNQIPHKEIKDEKTHPEPEERAKLLSSRLNLLLDKVDYFKYGVRLAHFQRYEDAVYFFREFQKVFPSREVSNNLGYCYLQMAVREMPPDLAYKFWLPSLIDVGTRADMLSLRGATRGIYSKEAAVQFIEEAAEYLETACKADKTYLPSRINLAAAYFYLEKFDYALAKINEACNIAPDAPDVQMMRELIWYHQDPVADRGPIVIKNLDDLSGKADAPLCISYNLAVLLEERGRSGNAQKIWAELAGKAEHLPDFYREEVTRRSQSSLSSLPEKDKTVKLSLPLPVEVGTDLFKNNEARKFLDSWEKKDFNWYNQKLSGTIYIKDGETSLLTIDGYVELIVISGDNMDSPKAVRKRYGEPLNKTTVAGGTVYSYGPKWAVLVRDSGVSEIWVARN